ncbi:MAG UNVERIFIED_CONTAM: hypothetical protein LVT10_12150 [Anaerolineae bacterium]|jgi:hypothetical protein
MDLSSGEGFTFGKDYAYSGMSLSKINILATIFKTWGSPAHITGST